jgi:DNA-binding GntR family transcriptional regulator
VTADPYYKEIADKIRRQITAGILRPGDLLPPRHEIAAEHGTSEDPVRRALTILESEGLIILRQGVRAKVAPPRP